MRPWVRLRQFAIAMMLLIMLALIGAAIATLYLDDIPKVITLVFGLASGFAAGSLLGMVFVQNALNNFMRANTRPSTLDDIVRARRR